MPVGEQEAIEVLGATMKSRKPAKFKPTLLIDSREQTCWEFSDRVLTERVTLPFADYSIAGMTELVAYERKELNDAVQSVTHERERFMTMCRELGKYEHKAIIIEASVDDVLSGSFRSRANPYAVLTSYLAIHADYGVPTIWAGDRHNAARIFEWLAHRHVANQAQKDGEVLW